MNAPGGASPQIEILSPGAYASVQDFGRRGYRRIGVPWSGVLDPRLMRIANALAGNEEGAPVIECFDGGLYVAARGGSVRLAVAGEAVLEVEACGEKRAMSAWRSMTLGDGQTLRIRSLDPSRIAVVAVAGMAVAPCLGSASTYARAALGGIDGRPLAAGARLPAACAPAAPECHLPDPPSRGAEPIRAVPGPQADHFADETRAAFFAAEYRVSSAADRMGVRLEGAALSHLGAREIVSDATVPGSIQVPGNGEPIVLLADAQTAGGYPKIATVIGADIPRLAAKRPGELVRFASVSVSEGERLARAAEAETVALLHAIRPLLPEGVDAAALYASNLVGGVVHALAPEYRPLRGVKECRT